MKKTLLLIVSLLFLLVNCGLSSKKKPPKPNPKQGIKTETVKLYNYKEKDSTFYEVSTTIFKYNSRGNPGGAKNGVIEITGREFNQISIIILTCL